MTEVRDLDESFISDLPYFEDEFGHMEPLALAWMEELWEIDAHMPMGLGGVRADMGMYGGPNNQYWGGGIISDEALRSTAWWTSLRIKETCLA